MPPFAPAQDFGSRHVPGALVLPKWTPAAVSHYLGHVCLGLSMRELARRSGCHASTILRQVRKMEARRDDPLVDGALNQLAMTLHATPKKPPRQMEQHMSSAPAYSPVEEESDVEKEARRILRRLCEAHTFLLVSPEMDKAAVFKEAVPGRRTRIAVVERDVAQAFALNEWITGRHKGRVGLYTITETGKTALKRLLAEDRKRRITPAQLADQSTPFQEQHREMGAKFVAEGEGVRKVRFNMSESPLTSLARKKAPDGTPYITAAHVAAGERLREDFEIAQMGPRVTQNWENFLTAATRGGPLPGGGSDGAARAQERVSAALSALGPGLADVAFRCCCFLEGLETAEKRLGWSARAGKVVLRIALQRLADHYENVQESRLIG